MSADGLGPLPLLAETWPLRELLILDFNANLGFFERAGLAKARSRGARVTMVSDADMVHADHEATRHAGRAYLDARAIANASAPVWTGIGRMQSLAEMETLLATSVEPSYLAQVGPIRHRIARWRASATMAFQPARE